MDEQNPAAAETAAQTEATPKKKRRSFSKHAEAPPAKAKKTPAKKTAAKKSAAKKTAVASEAKPAKKVTVAGLNREGLRLQEQAKARFFKASEIERKEKLRSARDEVKALEAEKKEYTKAIAGVDKLLVKANAELAKQEKAEAAAQAMKSKD